MSEQTQGKGRPTPKRSEAQKRRGGPVTPPPTNRREAAKQLRAKQAADRKRIRDGSVRGDDSAMLPRDRGPVRRLVRDIVDSRRSLGFLLLPIAVLVVVAGVLGNMQLQALTFGIWLATLLGAAIDMLLAGLQIRAALRSTFPTEKKVLGHVAYGLLRTTVIRRFRMPRPQVTRGQSV
ncbi:MAG: DUF3043 domain-containing protein [Mycobacteriales bacterium]